MAYLHNNKDQFQDAIELAYEQTGIMAQAIEKDYYVTMLLRLLSEKMPYIVFKGGTSLSKCHKVIKRFSEDIDITIDTQISQARYRKSEPTHKVHNFSYPGIKITRQFPIQETTRLCSIFMLSKHFFIQSFDFIYGQFCYFSYFFI